MPHSSLANVQGSTVGIEFTLFTCILLATRDPARIQFVVILEWNVRHCFLYAVITRLLAISSHFRTRNLRLFLRCSVSAALQALFGIHCRLVWSKRMTRMDSINFWKGTLWGGDSWWMLKWDIAGQILWYGFRLKEDEYENWTIGTFETFFCTPAGILLVTLQICGGNMLPLSARRSRSRHFHR